MDPHRRIMEQIITLLTLLAAIMTVLRQGENVDLPHRTAEHVQEERVDAVPAQRMSAKVKTKLR